METNFARLILPTLILFMLGFYFCRKPDPKPAPSQVEQAGAFMSQGRWQVSYFIENGNDKGKDLKNYYLVFKPDGSAYAFKGEERIKGAWAAAHNEKQDHMIMSFVVWPTDGMSKMWQVSEASAEKIHFISKSNTKEKSHLILERK